MTKANSTSQSQQSASGKTRSIYEWITLFSAVLVPVMIGVFTIVTTVQEIQSNDRARKQEIQLAHEQFEQNRRLADDAQKEKKLVDYQEFLAKVLREDGMNLADNDASRFAVRYRTLDTFRQIDPIRKVYLFKSLYEAKLITFNDDRNTLAAIDLSSADLTNMHLALPRSIFDVSIDFENMNLKETDLRNATISTVGLHGSAFDDARMDNIDMSYTYVYNRQESQEYSVSFTGSSMKAANLFHAKYYKVIFSDTKLNKANLKEVTCIKCQFFNADLNQIDITDAKFKDSLFADVNMTNCRMMNAFFNNTSFSSSYPQVGGSYMNYCNMNSAEFVKTNFIGVNLSNTDLTNVKFYNCTIEYSLFHGANLGDTNFSGTDMINSDLTGCIGLTDRQLNEMNSLNGTILPNGTRIP